MLPVQRLAYRPARIRPQQRGRLLQLPNELLDKILGLATAASLSALYRTCLHLRNLIERSVGILTGSSISSSKARLQESTKRPDYGNNVEEAIRRFVFRHGLPRVMRHYSAFGRDIAEIIAPKYGISKASHFRSMANIIEWILRFNGSAHRYRLSRTLTNCGCVEEHNDNQKCLRLHVRALADFQDPSFQNMVANVVIGYLRDDSEPGGRRERITAELKQIVRNIVEKPLCSDRPDGELGRLEHDFFSCLPAGPRGGDWHWEFSRRCFIDTAGTPEYCDEPCRLFSTSLYFLPADYRLKKVAKEYARLCGPTSWAPGKGASPYAKLLLAEVWEGMRAFAGMWNERQHVG